MKKVLAQRGETLTLATTVGFAQVLGLPPRMNMVAIEVPSATKENISVAFVPPIVKAYNYTSVGTVYTDITAGLTDRNTANTVSLNSLATADYVYVGSNRRFRGVAVDVTNTNSNAAVLTAQNWNGTTWAALTITDGTTSAGATFAQDGLITWTVPTTWAATTVNNEPQSLYWVRFITSAAFDSTVSVAQMTALANLTLNATTSDAEGYDYVLIQSNAQSIPPYHFVLDTQYIGGIEMKSTSITSAANINWYAVR